jgi:hypothetical protein
MGTRTVPVGYVFVCDAGRDVEHDDTTLAYRTRLENMV